MAHVATPLGGSALSDRGPVTEILQDVARGDAAAREQLYAQVYAELRAMAARHLRGERAGLTLQATDLVHEAFLKLVGSEGAPLQNRAHFLAVSSLAMRRILVDHARGKGRQKRGGGWQRVTLQEAMTLGAEAGHDTLLDIDAALARLAESQPERARVVELILFGGLKHPECAEVMGISPRTVARYWEYAQAWLYRALSSDAESA
jgi:RNA polymerase sigma factor (TIGR02999 family)